MAEYSMTYEELSFEIDKMIASIPEEAEKERISAHRAEILAAFTGDFSEANKKDVADAVELWGNQIQNRSEWVFKTTYIPVQSIMLDLVKALLTSGLIDELIVRATTTDKGSFTVAACSTIALTIWNHISDVKKLNDWDFCVYFQAVTHFREFKDFTKEDLMDWFPNSTNTICSMHNSQWVCSHRDSDDTCMISTGNKIDKAIESLTTKGILIPTQIAEDKWSYKFKR